MNSGERGTYLQSQKSPEEWVVETAARPIAFAQVREDSLLDQWVVEHLGEKRGFDGRFWRLHSSSFGHDAAGDPNPFG